MIRAEPREPMSAMNLGSVFEMEGLDGRDEGLYFSAYLPGTKKFGRAFVKQNGISKRERCTPALRLDRDAVEMPVEEALVAELHFELLPRRDAPALGPQCRHGDQPLEAGQIRRGRFGVPLLRPLPWERNVPEFRLAILTRVSSFFFHHRAAPARGEVHPCFPVYGSIGKTRNPSARYVRKKNKITGSLPA